MKRTWSLALVSILVSLVVAPISSAVSAEGDSPIVVQQWHTGIWVAWDRDSAVKSAHVAVKPSSEFNDGAFMSWNGYFINDFAYIQFPQKGRPTVPFKETFLVSVFAIDFKTDGIAEPPTCSPFNDFPRKRIGESPRDPRCLSETIFEVSVDLSLKKVKKFQQEGVTFVGVRDVNPLGSTDCQLGFDRKSGVCNFSDQMLYETKKAEGGKVLFFDSIIHVPIAKGNVGIQIKAPAKKGKTLWYPRSSSSIEDKLWRSEALVVDRAKNVKEFEYRHMAWDSSKKKYVWNGPTIDVSSTLDSKYGVDESKGEFLKPAYYSAAKS